MTTTLSTAITGIPRRTNRYHPSPTRHSTNRRRKRPTPSLPSVMPVMMNAAKVGPRKIEAGERTHVSRGLLKGRRPEPSSESTYGSSKSHVTGVGDDEEEDQRMASEQILVR